MQFKYKLWILFALAIVCLFPFKVAAQDKEVTLYVFHGNGCPHCVDEINYLKELQIVYPDLNIVEYEVWYNKSNQKIMDDVKLTLKNSSKGVPYTVIGTHNLTGFNDNAKSSIERIVKSSYEGEYRDIVREVIKAGKSIDIIKDINEENTKEEEIKTLPMLGKVNVKEISLPLIAVVIGLVDGFNPCAMWILIFIISMLLASKNKKRAMILGITFLLVSGIIYLFFMALWLNLAIQMSTVIWIRSIIALAALGGAFINIRSFIRTKNKAVGCEVVDDKKRKKLIDKIRKFTNEKSFFLAFFGIIAIAISVNLIELSCSAGLPLLFTQILAMNDLTTSQNIVYMITYIIFYMLDDIVIFVIAMLTLKVTGISNKYSKYSHLIGGIIMLIIGLLLLFKPEWAMLNF